MSARASRPRCRTSAWRCRPRRRRRRWPRLHPCGRCSPRFLVCSVDLRDGLGLVKLDAYRQASEAVSAPVVLEIVVPDETDAAASLPPPRRRRTECGPEPGFGCCFKRRGPEILAAGRDAAGEARRRGDRKAARAAFPGVRLGGGMLSTFTELNRKRPKPGLVDYVTHTTCSIVHAADDRSVMETLETIPAIIASTRAMIGNTPYRIGPSAIAARSNPYGNGLVDNSRNERTCLTDRDPRQRGLFNAAWALGYVAACAYGGLEARGAGCDHRPAWLHPSARPAPASPYFDSAHRANGLSGFPRHGRPRSGPRPPSGRDAIVRAAQRRPRSRGGRARASCCGSPI